MALRTEEMVLNMGPQHPSTHGVLRLELEIEGEGVIGQQPIIEQGDAHTYLSWSQLETEMGQMYGTYQMINVEDNKFFDVEIPIFQLIVPGKLN